MTITRGEFKSHSENNDGYCTACKEVVMSGVEPDATGVECPNCGESTVMGIEEALLMGKINIE